MKNLKAELKELEEYSKKIDFKYTELLKKKYEISRVEAVSLTKEDNNNLLASGITFMLNFLSGSVSNTQLDMMKELR